MRLICAWCEREGRPAALAEVEPVENLAETHGLCEDHRDEWMRSLGLGEPPPASPPPPA